MFLFCQMGIVFLLHSLEIISNKNSYELQGKSRKLKVFSLSTFSFQLEILKSSIVFQLYKLYNFQLKSLFFICTKFSLSIPDLLLRK